MPKNVRPTHTHTLKSEQTLVFQQYADHADKLEALEIWVSNMTEQDSMNTIIIKTNTSLKQIHLFLQQYIPHSSLFPSFSLSD